MTSPTSIPRPPIGWPLLPLPDEQGRLSWPSLEESIRQNLRVILATRPGELLMRPFFGAGLTEFIGESNDLLTRRRIHDRVTEAIGQGEPRIELDRVDLDTSPEHPERLRIEIAYRLRRTGSPATLGVTLDLGA